MWSYPFENVAESTELIAVAEELGVDYFVDMDEGADTYSGALWPDIGEIEEHEAFMKVYDD